MTDSSKEESAALASDAKMQTVPSESFFDDIKFYASGNVSEKVSSIVLASKYIIFKLPMTNTQN